MATRRRSYFIAIAATLFGSAFFYYDDLLDESHIATGIHVLSKAVEFVLLGPGMGVLVFALCEYLHVTQEKLRTERDYAQQERFLILGRIAASVAHEVRNPLHNIGLLIDELHHSGAMPADQPLCQRIEANLERINRAVELVYQLAKPSGTATQVDIGVDLIAILAESIDNELARSGATIERTLPETTAPVACPVATLRIVLDNLLRNAVAGGGPVHLQVQPADSAWEVVIRNRGTLPADLLGDGADEPYDSIKQGGLGIGLFISRHLLRSIDGSLHLTQQGDQVEARVHLPRWTHGSP